MAKNILATLKKRRLYFDGGTGTVLQNMGLPAGTPPELWNVEAPEKIIALHRDYINAGCNIINTNTFGINAEKYKNYEELIKAAFECINAAKNGADDVFVSFDVGPTGRLLKPLGDMDFEEAVELFAKNIRCAEKYGADLITIETMNDSYETKAALLAAKENCDLPVFVSNAYSEDGKLMTGADPLTMVALLEGMGADAVGVNCSLGPKALSPIVEQYLKYASVPVLLKPNAGLPRVENGKTVFDVLPDDFSHETSELIKKGVRIAGGCCGTTPDYISALKEKSRNIAPVPVTDKNITCVSSYTHAVIFGTEPVLIGERINPTGKKRFKEALKNGDMDYILNEGINQTAKGVHILDVNVGLPEIDEVNMLRSAVCELQTVVDTPLQIDTSDPVAMETALRRYNGKAMINSVNGKKDSMEAVFPLAGKYGGVIVALTLDENGIPDNAEGRVNIAKKILECAKEYGIDKKNIIFDPLALTVSADSRAAAETLRAVDIIKNELGCHTSLGVSNVSFGLPARDIINSTFFTMALSKGLSAAIMNPYSAEMMKVYYAFRALCGFDDNCADYIGFAQNLPTDTAVQASATSVKSTEEEYKSELQSAVIKGLRELAAQSTQKLLESEKPLDIVQNHIIPALNTVGEGFEKKTVYLPQLLMSAEAAKCAFEKIKSAMPETGASSKCPFVIATVKGDIHDIGKNIVKLLLENYGFAVTDLGRDVDPEAVAEAVIKLNAPMAGLSALMTTTVPAMEETIKLLRKKAPFCKVVVGGAVLNEEYARAIDADKYAKDAMETVRWAEKVFEEK